MPRKYTTTPEQRSEQARRAGKAAWAKHRATPEHMRAIGKLGGKAAVEKAGGAKAFASKLLQAKAAKAAVEEQLDKSMERSMLGTPAQQEADRKRDAEKYLLDTPAPIEEGSRYDDEDPFPQGVPSLGFPYDNL